MPRSRSLTRAVLLLGVLACAGCARGASAAASLCPGAVTWDEAGQHLREWTTVTGVVVNSFDDESAPGSPFFLDVGRDYPDPHRFTVIVWGRDLSAFPSPPDVLYQSRRICVTGLIDTSSGTPGIEVTDPSQVLVQ